MKKKITAFMLAVLMPLAAMLSLCVQTTAYAAPGTQFIVHYGGREDDNYVGWNMWIWEEGFEGDAYDFTAEDNFGKIAMYQCKENTDRIGFIVRLNNWEAKDIEMDRYADITGPVVEIWVTSGEEEFATTPPEGCEPFDYEASEAERLGAYDEEDALKLNVHYYGFDENYETVQCYAAIGENPGGVYPQESEDEFGAEYHAGFLDYEEESSIALQMLLGGAADTKNLRTVDVSKAVDGVLDVYVVQGNPQVWYSEEEVDKTPIIVQAAFDETTKHISIKTSKAIDTSKPEEEGQFFSVTDEEGNSYPIIKAWTLEGGMVTDLSIIMEDELDASKTYFIEREGFTGCEIAIGGAFSAESFEEHYTYTGDDLGAVYTEEKTNFRVWAPTASEVVLNLYEKGAGDCLIDSYPMKADVAGSWVYELPGDQNGVYYTYSVTVDGITQEAVDPYAKAVGVNGNRGMIIDLASTNPEGWDKDKHVTVPENTDAVIYEIHVRDTTIDESSGVENKGKYLGLVETGTKTEDGISTGLGHILDLGVTHVQIMPMYDYATVDETKLDTPQYNWGYDPKNYNVPEGSYSTDPYNGEVRIKEVKEMIKGFHDNEVGVIMDVVYNHVFSAEDSCLQKVVPDYYFRKDGEAFTNGSGCGNETASERSMMRKYIVDSCVYWVKEYHVDGFRFDLMGCIDQETMLAVRAALDEIDPNIIILGEGWTGGTSGLPSNEQTSKALTYKVPGVAAFSDDIRDAIKGSVFESEDNGFISGKDGQELGIQYGVVAATENEQIDYASYEKTRGHWAGEPGQCVTYSSCHDNLTLWDKIYYSALDATQEEKISMNKLSAAIIYTSQGVPFMLSGEEMLRSKPIEGEENGEIVYSHNSYNLNDYTNSMKWDTLSDAVIADMNEYYKGLIAFRKAHGGLRMPTTEEIQANLHFIENEQDNVVAYTIDNSPNGEIAERILVVYNGNKEATQLTLPEGTWNVCINGKKAGTEVLETANGSISVDGISAMVLVQGAIAEASDGNGMLSTILLIGGAAFVGAGGVIFARKRKNK